MADELTSMNISLPESMRDFARERMTKKRFANLSEYVRHLIRNDFAESEEERIDALLLEGLQSGPGIPVTPQMWADLDARVKKQVETLRAKKPSKRAG